MTAAARQAFTGARLFDGHRFHEGAALVVEAGRIAAVMPEAEAPPEGRIPLDGGILMPGLIDLQVNGGGGIMLDGACTPDRLAAICAAHRRLGVTGLLPTLISDTPAATAAVLDAGRAAARDAVPGFLGLHLEGPHLAPARKGAHDGAMLRPMAETDLTLLCDAAQDLPALMVTVAPEVMEPGQIRRLAAAGVIVSLGHSDATTAQAMAALDEGARCFTHLFNAMSQMSARAPGMVGAALACDAACGLIADGRHVDRVALRVALAARPEGLFLVSDSMAVAGTTLDRMTLGNRTILRRDGRLTLADGTLAGADLDLAQAIRLLVTDGLAAPERALAMATRIPAGVIGRRDIGVLAPGARADFVHLSDALTVQALWQGGMPVAI